jgi:hypothetical protein
MIVHPADVCEIHLRLTQSLALFLRPVASGGVDHCTHKFNEIGGWAENGMAYHVDVSDLAAGMNDWGNRHPQDLSSMASKY